MTSLLPAQNRPPHWTEWVRCALGPPVFGALDNRLSLDAYMAGEGWMIGDVVELRRPLRPAASGEILRLNNLSPTKSRYKDKFRTESVLVGIGRRGAYVAPSRLHLLRRPTTYRDRYIAWFEWGDEDDYWQTEAASDPYADFDEAAFPDWTVARSFGDGLKIAFSEKDDPLARRYFERAASQARHVLERGLIEKKSQAPSAEARDLAYTLLFRTLATALAGEGCEAADLLKAARGLERWCADVEPAYWDGWEKQRYLWAVMLAMIAGDMDYARTLLKTGRRFTDSEDHLRLLRKLARKTVAPHTDPDLVRRCRSFFDLMRHPYVSCHRDVYDGSMTALLWSVLIARFIDPRQDTVDWWAAVRAVSR